MQNNKIRPHPILDEANHIVAHKKKGWSPGGFVQRIVRSRLTILVVFVAIVIVAIVGSALYTLHWYHDSLKPVSSISRRVQVTVVAGDGPGQVANLLASKGLIRDATTFKWYVDHSLAKTELQAGTYLFSPSYSVQRMVTMMVNGQVDTYQITLLPGKYLTQIESSFEDAGFSSSSVQAAFAGSYSGPLFAGKPAGTSLEGYVFPDTYELTVETTPQQLLQKSFDDFYTQIQANDIIPKLQTEGFTLYQGITLASVVQQEASSYQDQQTVAQVFISRLKANMPLGSDVTFIYASHLAGIAPDLNISSPYNTRINPGLPPGPIGNISLAALEAVANPSNTSYLYFVAGDNGVLHFSYTQAQQQANTQQYCTKLCQ
ncbi:MAG TPA: endolytic transglycosylase MltG [Candidatus Saccharimonadales bacterium]|nr:endolytic transglycosylase MltG [Candidatus Saccharimonadales bacterium]